MTTLRQINSNRLNALKSTGPRSENGKLRSRCNAVRHGLTAETVIGGLEDADDYAAFEQAITVDYSPQTAVERELVLRLASLLWRLRRATTIETGLFETDPDLAEQEADPNTIVGTQAVDFDIDVIRGQLTKRFLRLQLQHRSPLDRLSRYEATLWRQARQILAGLHDIYQRKPRPRFASPH